MPTDFRDGKTFPRRGREPLGEYLWLPRVIDKARAKAARTHDGYIYPCPMDRTMMRLWGVSPHEFTTAIDERPTDDEILDWISQRVAPDRMQTANEWLLRQKDALDRHDAEEGVLGAVAPGMLSREIILGLAVAAIALLTAWLVRVLLH